MVDRVSTFCDLKNLVIRFFGNFFYFRSGRKCRSQIFSSVSVDFSCVLKKPFMTSYTVRLLFYLTCVDDPTNRFSENPMLIEWEKLSKTNTKEEEGVTVYSRPFVSSTSETTQRRDTHRGSETVSSEVPIYRHCFVLVYLRKSVSV